MRIYIDSNNKFTKEVTSTPIEIVTELFVTKLFESDKKEIHTIEGKLSYENNSGNVNINKYDYMKGEKLIDHTTNELLDEDIFLSNEIENDPYYKNILEYKKETVTEDNISLFAIDEILLQEHRNLLNKTYFKYIIDYILEDVVINESTFKCMDKHKMILAKGDRIVIKIDNLSVANEFRFINLNKNLTVFLNNNNVQFDDYFEIDLNKNISELNIEIINNTENNISIIDPYIFCK